MRLGGSAHNLAEVANEAGLAELVIWAKSKNLPIIMVGRGSNIVWRDEGFSGLILVNKIMGREVISEDGHTATVKINGGENWDQAVAWSVDKKLSGIEYMSLVPGTAGAAPVQNVGAYGGELSDTLVELQAYDTAVGAFVKLQNHECNFAYRTSRFKTIDKGRFLITSITLSLKKIGPLPPFYEALQNYLDENGISKYTPKSIRQAVIAIRQSKLPDPEKIANNGSFFTNPIISQSQFELLRQKYPDIKGWPFKAGRVKVSAGWLVERAGFRGVHDEQTGMATWDAQALVLVNEHARNTADLLEFRQKIIFKIDELFNIVLQQEPELFP